MKRWQCLLEYSGLALSFKVLLNFSSNNPPHLIGGVVSHFHGGGWVTLKLYVTSPL